MQASGCRTTADEPPRLKQDLRPTVLERLEYLMPTRYMQFCLLYDREADTTCWVPEGSAR